MKKTTLAIACLLGCTALSLSAQEAEKKQLHEIKVKFDKVPEGLANYYSGYYYYNGKEIYNMRNYLMYTGNRINALTINPSGSSYAFIDSKKDKNTVDVFSLMTKDQQLGKIATNKLFKPLAICYSPNAKFLYVMGSDSKIHTFETRKTREVKSFAINEPATRLDASPNGFFLIASTKNKLQVINLENETVRTTLPLKADFKDVAFSSNSKQMAVLAADGTCDVYDTKTFTVSKHFDAMGIAERCFFHPENKYLAIVTGDQRVAFINLLNEDDRQYVDAKEGGIKYINFSKNVKNDIYLVHNYTNGIVFTPVGFLSPNRQEKLKDELNSRMECPCKRGVKIEADAPLRVTDCYQHGRQSPHHIRREAR